MIQVKNARFFDDQGRELPFALFSGADSGSCIYDFTVEFSIEFSYSLSANITGDTIALGAGTWEERGFIVGAGVSGTYKDSAGDAQTIPGGTTIEFIDDETMVLSADLPGADGVVTIGKIVCDSEPEGFGFQFNLVPKNGPENGFSLVDSEQQRFETAVPSPFDVADTEAFAQLGNKSGGSVMFPTITRLPDDDGLLSYRVFTQFASWLIGSEMKVFYNAGNCVKPWMQIDVYPQFQNPSIKQSTTYAPSDGNSGFFDEVFNGGSPDYSPSSIVWTDEDGDIMLLPDHTQESTFTFTVDGVFTADSKFNLALFWDPVSTTSFKNRPNPMDNNRALCTSTTALPVGGPVDIVGSSFETGARINIEDLEILQFGTYATFTGKLNPNSAYMALIEAQTSDPSLVNSDRRFRFAVKVQNPDLEENYIRPVWLTMSYGEYTKHIKPLGVWEGGTFIQLRDHANVSQTSTITEDDVLLYGRFYIPKNDSSFTGLNLKVSAVKNTGESFVLENFPVDFSDFPVLPDGTIPVNQSNFNGYALPPSSDKNVKSVNRYTAFDSGSNFGLEFHYGTLLRWQYWLDQLNASFDFYGVDGEGRNQNWQHYQTGGWSVEFIMELQTTEGSYENAFPIPIVNYDAWAGNSEISFERLDGTPISNPIAGEIVKIIVDHTLEPSNAWVGDKWGMIRVYPFENGPDFTISTVLPSGNDPNNPLQPLNGEVGLKLTLPTPDVIRLECLFDTNKIAVSGDLTFTSRVDGFSDKGGSRRNRTKADFPISVKPFNREEEDRGFDDCCDPIIVLADTSSVEPSRNECVSAWERGDTVTFELRRPDGSLANYQPTAVPFVNQANAYFCTIQWRDVLLTAGDGVGCYHLYVTSSFASLETTYKWDEYELLPYKDNHRGTVMIRSVFNDVNKHAGIDFTGTAVQDCIRFKGRFGYFKPNIFTDNERYIDSEAEKVRREKLTTYELRVDRIGRRVVERLVNFHFLAENACWITDHNPDNYEYYRDHPVIFIEDIEPDHQPGNRGVKIGARYEDRIQSEGTYYDQDNPLASAILPPPVLTDIAQVINSAEPPTFSATFSTSAPYELPDTTVETYEMVDGVPVLVDTFTFPTLEPDTEISIDL
jgi:hypothetical protein